MSIQAYDISKSAATGVYLRQSKNQFNKISKNRPYRTEVTLARHDVIKNRIRKFLIQATVLGSMLCLGLVSSTAVVADEENDISNRIAVLEAKEQIRAQLHAIVNALNSSFIYGATDPLEPIAAMLHPEIVLSTTPPSVSLQPNPETVTFSGKNQVIEEYGQHVVAVIKPNILVSSMDVKLLMTDSAEANLRFASSVILPSGCLLDTPECINVLMYVDVFVSFERGAQQIWQATHIDLVHHIVHGG